MISLLAIGLFAIAAFLMISPFVIQTSNAQQDTANFVVRIIQGAAHAGLVNVAVQVGSVVVNDVVDVNNNNIAVPITIPIAANENVGATVCATILSSGDQVCRTVQNVQQDATNVVPTTSAVNNN